MATISFIFWICYAFITGKRKAKPDETRITEREKVVALADEHGITIVAK